MSAFWVKKTKRYKRHFLCFECRKNFKKPNEKDLAETEGELSLLLNAFYYSKPKKKVSKDVVLYLKEKYFKRKEKCPECGLEMIEVSMSFETPAKKNLIKWKNLKSFYNAEGFVRQDLPLKKKEFIVYLEESIICHINMLQNAEKHCSNNESVIEAKNRLRENILNIKEEVEKIKKSH